MTKSKIKNTYVPKLFDKPSYLTKITLKKSLSRGSRFKIYFVRNAGEIEDRALVSTSPPFRDLLINNVKSRNISSKNNRHVNANKI